MIDLALQNDKIIIRLTFFTQRDSVKKQFLSFILVLAGTSAISASATSTYVTTPKMETSKAIVALKENNDGSVMYTKVCRKDFADTEKYTKAYLDRCEKIEKSVFFNTMESTDPEFATKNAKRVSELYAFMKCAERFHNPAE